ncbi:MAG: 5'-methylthioadenosine/S-adenosylhomocysteine nucleosidase [Anaerolineaceae bacterium]|nr:5'-methylthioadenosine/S-adenosylhomocysteine nucleosidase [Anaerolineaceae bacterium]
MSANSQNSPKVLVIVSAEAEWKAVEEAYPGTTKSESPFGCWFTSTSTGTPILFFQGGWGKISAAASTQYAVQRWNPHLILNFGTCGGFKGDISPGEIVLVEETIVYDILEQMGDLQEALDHYTTRLDLSWLKEPYPIAVRRGRLISADRDILPADIPMLREKFAAKAADWESAAIAWVAKRNNVACLILRGVSDLVDPLFGGEAYGSLDSFIAGSQRIMNILIQSLPAWLESAGAVLH